MDKLKEENSENQLFHSHNDFLKMQHLYKAAIHEIEMRLDILSDEFSVNYSRNPIHHVESRLKSTDSIVEKLIRKGYPVNSESAMEHLNDIAGIRVVCNYIEDVYDVEKMIARMSDIELVKRQDYIENPNFNGYRSLHLDVLVPVFLSDRKEKVSVEIQIRSVAMDFWASLEHDVRYKVADKATLPRGINEEMLQCSDEIAEIDRKMQDMFKRIQEAK